MRPLRNAIASEFLPFELPAGPYSTEILEERGYDAGEIDELVAEGANPGVRSDV